MPQTHIGRSFEGPGNKNKKATYMLAVETAEVFVFDQLVGQIVTLEKEECSANRDIYLST